MRSPAKPILLLTLLTLPMVALNPPPAAAQGIYADLPRPIPSPPSSRLVTLPAPTRLVLQHQKISAKIGDVVAEWRIEQVFLNPTSRVMEGIYLFPIPKDAVARGVSLWMDGKEVAGEILDTDKAKGIYQDIVRKMRDPALLEYVDQGLVRASIYPVPANGTVTIAIEFASSPVQRGDVRELILPLRFAAEANAPVVVDAAFEMAHAISTIYSPTHDVDVVRHKDQKNKARVTYEGKPTGRADLRLYFATDDGPLGMSLIAHRLPASPGTFAFVMSPQSDASAASMTPRDVVFTLDRSGSMAGEKWTQAIAALQFGLTTLNPGDRFALVSFATDVRVYKDGLLPANKEEIAGAKAHLEGLRPAGGTQISGALDKALEFVEAEDRRLKIVTFLTDGLPTIGETDPQRILELAKSKSPHARVFPFGIGFDVNSFLLDKIAEAHHGATDYVQEGDDLEIPLSAFFAHIQEPVLIAPKLEIHGVEVFDQYPPVLPDLFAGSQLVVVGRYLGEGPHAITVTGRSFSGEARSFTTEATFPKDQREPRALPSLWAARKVGYLLTQIRLHGASKELVDQVVELGREHGIVTPYTAGLVVEEGMDLAAAAGFLRDSALPGTAGTGPTSPGGSRAAGAPAAERKARSDLEELDLARSGGKSEGRAADKKAVLDSLSIKSLAEAVAGEDFTRTGRVGNVSVERLKASGRRLVRVDAVVVDTAYVLSMKDTMVEIETFSDAWFALITEDPDLRELLALGDEILFVKDGKAIWVHPAK